jgi:hypothetical protein
MTHIVLIRRGWIKKSPYFQHDVRNGEIFLRCVINDHNELWWGHMKRVSALLAVAFVSISIPARAGYIVDVQQVGANVVATGAGSFDLTSLTHMTSSSPIAANVDPNMGTIRVGSSQWDSYTGIDGPLSFGPGGLVPADAWTGLFAGLLRIDDINGTTQGIFVPVDLNHNHYVSGTLLDPSSATWDNASFASLGLNEGTYVWNWGSGDTADTFTLEIGSVDIPEAPSLAIMFAGLGLIGGAMWRRRTKEILPLS